MTAVIYILPVMHTEDGCARPARLAQSIAPADPFPLAPDEPLELRQAAGRAGWRVDDDGWFWRAVRPTDIVWSPDDGFTAAGFICEGKVFMPDCETALRFDRGEWRAERIA